MAAKIESARRTPDFVGFHAEDGGVEAWLRADLLRVFKRSADEFAVARPLHLQQLDCETSSKAGDSGASGIVYTWLEGEAGGPGGPQDLDRR